VVVTAKKGICKRKSKKKEERTLGTAFEMACPVIGRDRGGFVKRCLRRGTRGEFFAKV